MPKIVGKNKLIILKEEILKNKNNPSLKLSVGQILILFEITLLIN